MEEYLKYLQAAKDLTGSSNIDELIESAKKIYSYVTQPKPPAQHFYKNIVDFATSTKVLHPIKGGVPLCLHDYQRTVLNTISTTSEKLVVLNSARQMGMTTMMAVYALHEAISKPDQCILICSSKFGVALEIMERVRYAMTTTNAMMPIVIENNKSNIAFNNGSKIMGRAASSQANSGCSLTHLIIDSAAFISYKILDDFWTAIQPTLKDSKVIFQSSPQYKEGLFYRMWDQDQLPAERILIKWDMHPDRDEEWGKMIRSQIGPDMFSMQFECEFLPPPIK